MKLEDLKYSTYLKKIRKTMWYSRLRQYFPMPEPKPVDDRATVNRPGVEVITLDWPAGVKKPRFGIVQDYGPYPRWTKYIRFLEINGFEYELYNIHAHDWIEQAKKFDIVLGFFSTEWWHLQEMREKYYFIETVLGKATYPSTFHANLYEDKKLEAYLAEAMGAPYIKTYVSHDKEDALRLVEGLKYPLVSKIVPASGSSGVELVRNVEQARNIVQQAFSVNGRQTHLNSLRQKNYVYFQDFVPNDGLDTRIIVIGEWAFGYIRRVLSGDFRASGMKSWEWAEMPPEAMKIARRLNKLVKSPFLAVDMLCDTLGNFHIIEFSPICQVEDPEQTMVNGVMGGYLFTDDDTFHYEPKFCWPHDMALVEFLQKDYLPRFA